MIQEESKRSTASHSTNSSGSFGVFAVSGRRRTLCSALAALLVLLPLVTAKDEGGAAIARGEISPAQVADPCAQVRIFAPYTYTNRRAPFMTATPGAPRATPFAPRCTPTPGGPTPTPTRTLTPGGPTPTSRISPTPGDTAPTPIQTPTPGGPTLTPTLTPTPSVTPTPTQTVTPGGPTLTPTLTPSPTVTPTPVIPVPAEGILGLQLFEGDLAAIYADRLNEAGSTWARTRILWGAVEPVEDGPREWGMSDSMVSAIARQELKGIVSIYKWPTWADASDCGPLGEDSMNRYADFVEAAVERYDGDGRDDMPGSPRVEFWEIGNEPDFSPSAGATLGESSYGSCFGDDSAAYAELLVRSHAAITSADRSAKILFGGVAYDRFADYPDLDPGTAAGPFRHDFVGDVLGVLVETYADEPGYPFFDMIGFHNYNDFRDTWDGPDGTEPEIVGKTERFREQQLISPDRFDFSDMPLVSTEVGIASGPSDEWTVRSEEYQAAYAGQVAVRALAAGLRAVIWYTATDYTGGNCDDLYSWLLLGLMRSEWVAEAARACPDDPLPDYRPSETWERKPAYDAFATASSLIGEAEHLGQLSPAELGVTAVEAHRLLLPDGRSALVAFTDHGRNLGSRRAADVMRSLTVDEELVGEWTGRLRIIDHLGEERVLTGDSVEVRLTYRPQYFVVEP